LALDEYIENEDIALLEKLYNALNAMDMGGTPVLSPLEQRYTQSCALPVVWDVTRFPFWFYCP
jgi:hypothetical protein